MQNRKTFLKTAAVGVAGAIGLSLIPSKALAETVETNELIFMPQHAGLIAKYCIPISEIVYFSKLPHVNKIELYAELHNHIQHCLLREFGSAKGWVHSVSAIHSRTRQPVYGFMFSSETVHGDIFTHHEVWGLDWRPIDKTLHHIINNTPDPFMEYPYVD